MRRSIIPMLLLLLILGIAIVGFARGWFALSGQQTDQASDKVDVKLTIDPEKAKDDTNYAAEQVTNTVKEGAREIGDRVK